MTRRAIFAAPFCAPPQESAFRARMPSGKAWQLGCAAALAVLAGCSGHADDGEPRLETRPQTALGELLPTSAPARRAYVGVTNHVALDPTEATRVSVGVVPGGRVRLEVAARDGEALRFKILRRSPAVAGGAELLNPVSAASGFKLTTLEAKAGEEGAFLLVFPASIAPRDVVVWMDCESPGAQCTPELQPGDGCFADVRCDEGLECRGPDGTCDPVGTLGVCGFPRASGACASRPPPR